MADDHLDFESNYIEGSDLPVTSSRFSNNRNRWDSPTTNQQGGRLKQQHSYHGSDGEKRKLEMDRGGGDSSEDEDDDDDGEDGNEDGAPRAAVGRGYHAATDSAKKQKISIGFNKTFSSVHSASEKKSPLPISIKLGAQKKPKETTPNLKKASTSVASIFNQDSDEEEMPPEAKMRMRNIGRDTPTSAGPNSFGKTRQGFCDVKKVFERQLKKQIEEPH